MRCRFCDFTGTNINADTLVVETATAGRTQRQPRVVVAGTRAGRDPRIADGVSEF